MLEVTFKVFSVDSQAAKVPAKLGDGTVVEATVPATRLQLVPDDAEAHSTVALLLTGGDAEAAKEFQPGDRVVATFAKEQ